MNHVLARRTMNSLAALLLVAGVLVWAWPAAVPSIVLPNQQAALEPRETIARNLSSEAATIVSSNIFSSSRVAPAARYNPSGSAEAAAERVASDGEIGPSVVSPPRVYGTMTGPNGSTALIEADSAGSASRLYREGERVGPFRIEKILTNSVIVKGPGGRLELKVERKDSRE